MSAATKQPSGTSVPRIRRVQAADIAAVISLDRQVTGLAKPRYWREVFERYGKRGRGERFFLVAQAGDRRARRDILGFIIGEIRAWEFGSAPCGWVFALSVDPSARLRGVGEALYKSISADFKKAGITKMRTMVARDNPLPMLFFRAQGMMAGPYVQLEKDLD